MTAATTPPSRASRARASDTPTLVGRDDEVAAVRDAIAAGSTLVVVEGEPGVGKTRLLQEVLASADADRAGSGGRTPAASRSEADGAHGVQGPLGRGLVVAFPAVHQPAPLGAVVAGIQRLDPDIASLDLSGLAGALRGLFPEWADALPVAPEPLEEPSAVRHRLQRALAELVEALDVQYLVMEDAQWADHASLEWLLVLHSQSSWGDRSVVVTYRPWDVPDDSLLPRVIGRVPAAMTRLRIHLDPLGPEQIRDMVSFIYDRQEVSGEFAQFLYDATDGLPLAVQEYLLLLEDREDILEDDGQWSRRAVDELSVPAGVRESVLERFQRLDGPTQRILQAASIDAEPAGQDMLAAIAELEADQVRGAMATALGCGLLQEHGPGRFGFRHLLDAQAIRESMPVSERRHLHATAAACMQAMDHPPVARLADHCREAGDLQQWSRAAEASARSALDSGDDRTAVETLLQVIDTDQPADRLVALATVLAEAAFKRGAALGDLNQAVVAALRRVLDNAGIPASERGELRLELGRMLWQTGQWQDAFDQWERAAELLGDRPKLAIRAMSNMGVPLIPSWPDTRHRHWLDKASDLVDQVDDHDRLAHVHMRISALLLMGDELGLDELRALPDSGSDTVQERDLASLQVNAALALLQWGRYDDAAGLLAAARRRLEDLDYDLMHHIVAVTEARRDWYTGHWDGLRARARAVFDSQEPDSSTRLHARQLHALVQLAGGARVDAEAELLDCARQLDELGLVSPGAVVVPAALGRLHLAVGDVAATLEATTPTVDMIRGKRLWFWVADVADVHVTALVRAGRLDDAHALVTALAEEVADRDMPAPEAALRTCRAVIAGHAADGPVDAPGAGGDAADRADGHRAAAELFDAAAEAWAALPRPYDELLCRERAALARLAAGMQADGLQELQAVQQRLVDLGAAWDADRVARELRDHGHEVPRTWRGGRRGYGDELSPRETEVVQLVAQGHTNQQVADALFISRRTVEGHVSSAMRKLDVSSRTALAVAAVEAGITLRNPNGHVPQV